MRIVFFYDRYSEGMGYNENALPPLLAARGHEVFVVTSTMQVYGDAPFYDKVYRQFLGPAIVEPGRKTIDGVTVIRLPIRCWWKRIRVTRGAHRFILNLKPDIVQTDDPRSLATLRLSFASWFHHFKLFSSEHTVASVYPAYFSFKQWPMHTQLYHWLTEFAWGWLASRRIVRCYAPTPDAGEIAVKFHGVRPHTIRHLPLGVDVRLFYPLRSEADNAERQRTRREWGITEGELVCIYTGRFTDGKNPLCLAQAITRLRAGGAPFRAIFFGEGEQAAAIAATDGCEVRPFMAYLRLGAQFRAADIGVWPCQESISMIDAAACGIPIVVSNRIKAVERVEGNGLTYEENDPDALAAQLSRLKSVELRQELGQAGAKKMHSVFSTERVIDVFVADYEAALKSNRP